LRWLHSCVHLIQALFVSDTQMIGVHMVIGHLSVLVVFSDSRAAAAWLGLPLA
jgi:hypothetical protein